MSTSTPICLCYPGKRIALPNGPELQRNVIDTIERELSEAAVCLAMFEKMSVLTHAMPEAPTEADEQWDTVLPHIRTTEDLDKAMAEADRRDAEGAREALQRGETPIQYARLLDVIYARSFVSSLRIIRRLLNVVGTETGLDLTSATQPLDAACPHIVEVRDASAHREERIRGLAGFKGEPIMAPVIVVETLHGNNLISTVDTAGRLGHVPISAATLAHVVRAVQVMIERLPWQGQKRKWYF